MELRESDLPLSLQVYAFSSHSSLISSVSLHHSLVTELSVPHSTPGPVHYIVIMLSSCQCALL